MKPQLIDQVEFFVSAGNGGRGIISWRREKYIPKGGPDGGDGGNGGSIYLETNPHVNTLLDYAGIDHFEAKIGEQGKPRIKHGKNSADLFLKVPVGTVVYEKTDTGYLKLADLTAPNQQFLLAKGGKGGRGNTAFKSSILTTPYIAEPGTFGERKTIKLELKILADIGLVGEPNVGKSTLLSVLTSAKPQIAPYPFTTLIPNLGVLNQLVIADIPGLIKNAHLGKGLGIDFLRHIERCKILVYVIAPNDNDLNETESTLSSTLINQYNTVQTEITTHNADINHKKIIIVLNKIDLLTPSQINKITQAFNQIHQTVIPVSGATTQGIKELSRLLISAVTHDA